MRPKTPQHWCSCAAIALCALLSAAGRPARAGCGDYVVVGNPNAIKSDAASRPLPAHVPAKGHGEPGPAPRRCSGPTCSGKPAVPLTPAPTATPAPSHDEALSGSAPSWRDGAIFFLCGSPAARPVHGHPSVVEHPPR